MTKRSSINKGEGGRRKQQQPKHKQVADENVEEDRISNLGDDILVSIISRLTTRDATATSVLSSRWQHLHTRVSRLVFFPEDLSPYFEKEKESLMDREKFREYVYSLIREQFRKHVKRVNRTLGSYEGGQTLNELRIHSYNIEGADLKRWLEFGLSREVQILDIRMTDVEAFRVYPHANHSLQLEKNLLIKSSTSVQGLKSLRELSLRYVDVNDLEIKLLVSHCPNLESLSIKHTNMLRHISIVGHPKLRHLNLSNVFRIESIEIENVLNLVSLKCFSLMQLPSTSTVVRLSNLPKLIELDTNAKSHNFLFKLPSCICSQLMVFRVSTKDLITCQYPIMFPRLINVKHLELEFDYNWRVLEYTSASAWVGLLASLKFLETFQLKTVWEPYDKFKFGVRGGVYEYSSEGYKVSPKLHKVKLSGYEGLPWELEFTVFIIQHAAGLKELTIEPCRASKLIRQIAIGNLWEQLGPIIPNSLNFVVI